MRRDRQCAASSQFVLQFGEFRVGGDSAKSAPMTGDSLFLPMLRRVPGLCTGLQTHHSDSIDRGCSILEADPCPLGSRAIPRPRMASDRSRPTHREWLDHERVLDPPWLGVRPVTQAFYHCQDFVCPAIMNKINRTFAIQEPVSGIEPEPRFLRRIKLRKAIHDVAKIGDKQLSLWMRKRGSGNPTGNGGRRHGR